MDKLLAASRNKWFWLSHHHRCPVSAAGAALLSSQSALLRLPVNHHQPCCINCVRRNFVSGSGSDFGRYAISGSGSCLVMHTSVNKNLGLVNNASKSVNSSFHCLMSVASRSFHSSSVDLVRKTGYSNFGHKQKHMSKWSYTYGVFLAAMFLFFFCLNGCVLIHFIAYWSAYIRSFKWLVEKTNMDGTPSTKTARKGSGEV